MSAHCDEGMCYFVIRVCVSAHCHEGMCDFVIRVCVGAHCDEWTHHTILCVRPHHGFDHVPIYKHCDLL